MKNKLRWILFYKWYVTYFIKRYSNKYYICWDGEILSVYESEESDDQYIVYDYLGKQGYAKTYYKGVVEGKITTLHKIKNKIDLIFIRIRKK